VKAPKTSGGRRTPVCHTIPLAIVIFLVYIAMCDRIEHIKGLYQAICLSFFWFICLVVLDIVLILILYLAVLS